MWRCFVVLILVTLTFDASHAAEPKPEADISNSETYILGTGDRIQVTIYGHPDLSGEFEIGSGGTVAMPLIGAVSATKASLPEFKKRIEKALKEGFMNDPKVSVSLIEARPFYILGDVNTPGSYPYVEGLTVLNAIALAGGMLAAEDRNEVRVRVEAAEAREEVSLRRDELHSALAQEARLMAERDGLSKVEFSEELTRHTDRPETQALMEAEREIFKAQKRAIEEQRALLEGQIPKIEEEIDALNQEREAKLQERNFIGEELNSMDKLEQKGYARKTQVLELRREAASLEGEAASIASRIAQAEQKIGDVKMRRVSVENDRLNQVLDMLKTVQGEISAVRTSLQTAEETLRQRQRGLALLAGGSGAGSGVKLTITRYTPSGPELQDAEEDTIVYPGDIVRVTMSAPETALVQ